MRALKRRKQTKHKLIIGNKVLPKNSEEIRYSPKYFADKLHSMQQANKKGKQQIKVTQKNISKR